VNYSGAVSNEGKSLQQLSLEDMIDDDDQLECIEVIKTGFKVNVPMPSSFHKFLIGKRGEKKKQIEHQTRTIIRVPAKGSSGNVGMVQLIEFQYIDGLCFCLHV
jgi:hypothetical protein